MRVSGSNVATTEERGSTISTLLRVPIPTKSITYHGYQTVKTEGTGDDFTPTNFSMHRFQIPNKTIKRTLLLVDKYRGFLCQRLSIISYCIIFIEKKY